MNWQKNFSDWLTKFNITPPLFNKFSKNLTHNVQTRSCDNFYRNWRVKMPKIQCKSSVRCWTPMNESVCRLFTQAGGKTWGYPKLCFRSLQASGLLTSYRGKGSSAKLGHWSKNKKKATASACRLIIYQPLTSSNVFLFIWQQGYFLKHYCQNRTLPTFFFRNWPAGPQADAFSTPN